MAYIQKNNPIPRTGCGRRRAEQMSNPFKKETQMDINPNAKSSADKKSKYATAPIPGVKQYKDANMIQRAFMEDPRVTSGVVPFGGGKLGKIYKVGKKIYDKVKSPNKKISKASLSKVSTQLKKASRLHVNQASKIDKAISGPMKKISGPCKSAAKKKFKVWPSAYASGWGVRCTKAGGPGSMGKSKK